jgi:hypothetical protein
MIAHTPGPWILAKGHRGLYGAGPDNAVLDYAHYEGMWLASPNEVPNARLIAAAPELLEVARLLESLCVWMLRRYPSNSPEFAEALSRHKFAAAAIAKAGGRE